MPTRRRSATKDEQLTEGGNVQTQHSMCHASQMLEVSKYWAEKKIKRFIRTRENTVFVQILGMLIYIRDIYKARLK
jgi:hypothetical protein